MPLSCLKTCSPHKSRQVRACLRVSCLEVRVSSFYMPWLICICATRNMCHDSFIYDIPLSCVKISSPRRSRQVLGASSLCVPWFFSICPRLIHIWHASFMCKKHAHHVYLVRFLVRFTRVYTVSWCTWFFMRICQNMTMKVAKTHRMTYLGRAAARCTTLTLPRAIRVGQTRRKNIR